MDWDWFLKAAMKPAVFAGPAIATLAFWMKQDVKSKMFYRVSWANPIGNLLWLVLIAILGTVNESPVWRGSIPSSLPAAVFFELPFLFAFCSLVLCVASVSLKAGERGVAACANGLMCVLWLSVVVAPN